MPKFLEKIKIVDFKSFTEEEIDLNKVTCIVGANESGKTNLLDAIFHLSKQKQVSPFTPDELRIGSPDYPKGEIKIEYTIKLSDIFLPDNIVKNLPGSLNRSLVLTKIGRPSTAPLWGVASDITQSSIPDIIEIKNKRLFIQSFSAGTNELKEAKQRSEIGWFVNDSAIDLRKSPYKKLLDEEKIVLLKGKEKVGFINEILKSCVLGNINLYQWRYRPEDFLQENVSIADLIQNPNKYRSVVNMFTISGWKKNDLATNLQNQTSTVYTNLLNQIKRSIDSLIKNQWSSHKNLQIQIEHRGDNLTIHLHEPGSHTPPEFRSDGLKWFLTFLINFRAQSKTVSNFVLLVDEPGLYLHPRGQKDALGELEGLSRNNQIIYTTHQTFLINKNEPERVRIIHRATEKGGRLKSNPFYASKVSVINTKNILTDKLLREALGFKVSDISPINEKNILVEGVFDREVLYIANEHFPTIDLNDTSIISCGRASEITKHATLYKQNNLSMVCFYDSDDPGKSSFKSNDKVLNSEKVQVRNFNRSRDYETMEDLLPDRAFDAACTDWAKQWRITFAEKIKRPRIKNLEKCFQQGNRIEMKRSLEDKLIAKIKEEIKKNPNEFDIFKKILEDLRNKLSK